MRLVVVLRRLSPFIATAVALGSVLLALALVAPDETWPPKDVAAVDPRGGASPAWPAAGDTPEAEPWRPRRARIVMGGDLLWHNTVWQAAQAEHARTGKGVHGLDLAPIFADVADVVRGADLAICQEEVPFAGPGRPWQNFPLFAAPPQIAQWIAEAGFDACVTASNHSIDQGYEGLVTTADRLEEAGVPHVGTFRTRAERREPVVVTTDDGVRIGLVAGTYGTNGIPLPHGREWSVSSWDPDNLLAQARAARRAGAEVVVVHLHGGTEYDPDPNVDQVHVVEQLTASGEVDLVLGSHAHVVQPITRVNGVWVVYGMGNMIAQQDPASPRTYEGVLADFTFRETAPGEFEVVEPAYHPITWNTWYGGATLRVLHVNDALAEGRGDRARLLAARERTREAVNRLGGNRGLVER